MKKFLIIAIIFFSIVSFVSCGSKGNAEAAKTEEEAPKDEHENENPNMAVLSDEQIKSIGIELGTIEQKQLTAALKTNGVL